MKKLLSLLLISLLSLSIVAQNTSSSANNKKLNKAGKDLKVASGLYYAAIGLNTLGVLTLFVTQGNSTLPLVFTAGGAVSNLIAIGKIGQAGDQLQRIRPERIYPDSKENDSESESESESESYTDSDYDSNTKSKELTLNDRYYINELVRLDQKENLNKREQKKYERYMSSLSNNARQIYEDIKVGKDK